jgi:hypothetical protein
MLNPEEGEETKRKKIANLQQPTSELWDYVFLPGSREEQLITTSEDLHWQGWEHEGTHLCCAVLQDGSLPNRTFPFLGDNTIWGKRWDKGRL